MRNKRMTIYLTNHDHNELLALAEVNCRSPRQQAAWLIEQGIAQVSVPIHVTPQPGHVLLSNLKELTNIATEVGAEAHHVLQHTTVTFQITGPAVVIVAYPVEDGEPGL